MGGLEEAFFCECGFEIPIKTAQINRSRKRRNILDTRGRNIMNPNK
jgi:hypothetical protein